MASKGLSTSPRKAMAPISILRAKNMELQRMKTAMRVTLEMLQLEMTVLQLSLLLTSISLLLVHTPSLGGLLLFMLIPMILERVDTSSAKALAMLVEGLPAALSGCKVKKFGISLVSSAA
ncbi:unnamed protein product [Linum tenue]|uniref:Uncharacterized protein n=1 Tax=Linum tenue TaxID=586396 RepID=A0AAV0LEA0_9ROSI|nr:unnamed protein product [Linum tenue]